MAKWIWNFGDFEIYHSLQLHDRRIGYGSHIPPMWKMYSPETNVRFKKDVEIQNPGSFRVTVKGHGRVTVTSMTAGGEVRQTCPAGTEIFLQPGSHHIVIQVSSVSGLPCAFSEGCVETDETWLCDDVTENWVPVGSWDKYDSCTMDPEVFPFSEEILYPVNDEVVEGGLLFDFGKEIFGKAILNDLPDSPVRIRLGESREEALDDEFCVLSYTLTPENGCLTIPSSGFRYLFVSDSFADAKAIYEYLPLNPVGAFSCKDETIDWVWNTAAYTLHLNSREFFLDGIKRDRWVWSADAYQTQFVNHYLFMDPEVEKRTLIALGGKAPFIQHINTIVDYTFFWVMGLWEYYRTYGDKQFLKQILPQLNRVMAFVEGRLSEDGLIRGKEEDWVFIDWSMHIDKTGAVLGEQILLGEALEKYGMILNLLDQDGSAYKKQAEEVRKKCEDLYWDEEKGAFIDSYESGKKNVSRHGNLWAYLYLPLSEEKKQKIYENVVLNDAVPPLTTPYFKFYENQVHCEAGDPCHKLEDCILNYYGPMKDLNATTLFEEFDPTMKGAEHYAMYGLPYDKSLCHAWSSSPIYLIGAYRMGVKNTGIAYDTFEVKPVLGALPPFKGTVPLPKGKVEVQVNEKEIRVLSTVQGGTLLVNDRKIPLTANEEISVRREA